MAAHAIRAGEAKNVKLNRSPGSLEDVYIPIGLTAENVAERCGVTREQQGRASVAAASASREPADRDREQVVVVGQPLFELQTGRAEISLDA